ncbi:MAG: trigger factor [Acidimicrobiales bacterium]
MRSTVEPLEGNKVKLSVEVEAAEFEKDIDAAFRRIAREVRLPGFRPGKAPRRLLEAKLGAEVGREEALREALPSYYVQAVKEHDVDVIAAPEIDITEGQEVGPVTFDAVVEVRPVITIGGYEGLRVELPRIEATDEEIDIQIDKLRQQFAELASVERPAHDGDHVSIGITGSRDGDVLPGLQADDYLYELGSAAVAPELDENLRGAKVGDILRFDAQPEGDDEDAVQFEVIVKSIKEKMLPEVDDAWANDVSEFDSVDELRADLNERISKVRKIQAQMAMRDKAVLALVQLVQEEAPEAMVSTEVQNRLQDLSMRLNAQGVNPEQYLAATGQSAEEMVAGMRESAVQAVKADMALRALAEAEGIECDDDDLDAEIGALAARVEQKPEKVRKELERAEQMQAVRSDVRKRKAVDWLAEQVELVDEDGQPIDRAALALPDADDDELDEDELIEAALMAEEREAEPADDDVPATDQAEEETNPDGARVQLHGADGRRADESR